jgi:uncharacterized protein YfaS (alpha-2-macroglobulin family)
VQMEVPEKVAPRQRVEIPVSISNMAGAKVYLTVAAVDEGILTLTDFATPDPVEYFFGRRSSPAWSRSVLTARPRSPSTSPITTAACV